MGKKLLQQRAGRGGINFRSPSWRRVGPARYPNIEGDHKGKIIDILHNPGVTAPVVKVKLDNGLQFYIPAVQGVAVGQEISIGKNATISNGNIVEVGQLPEGTVICNVEKLKGDGGKFARAAGSYAVISGKAGNKVLIKLSSEKIVEVSQNARATVGIIAGGGFVEKPLLKAGNNYWKYRVRAVKWPVVRGVAMNAVSHPHGGGLHQSVSRPSTVSRNAPPGRKVGHIASRRTGRRGGA
ncbi:50S ribosomal protein L2 [Sulfolobus acidocaldarius]|uniref:Large ribosomal subunit protein uL2 n=5 Tax=Sulfolobus acidocaldarius TaxID=2285 RepID=RL2_SULAC|nr:50S ribosomal protein L2 [Sulfolobus acidocaldarius]Q4JB43.1 RecName: Full=Large ribosomal subunit protein uL2; AltName: Full=50S ribosomal protein L2 [Sulfolobus acidocaldarius DSM 639]AAY79986.1 50S ribosomal protein L2P [Sulfolobus acidocaldarius DSM 639]AGE70555.1 50S ribosomal protein L2P [Sulfolobus acidocaldarius N8]AGE72828.1 50S ribosomal protein L2P [Sulfolobus acidocaldarius Ron12/I]ALU29086.1 50S ribosomal protein L2 [Sulfolobus acidocaldarius]ALU31812.1 50S ribosomal protein L